MYHPNKVNIYFNTNTYLNNLIHKADTAFVSGAMMQVLIDASTAQSTYRYLGIF